MLRIIGLSSAWLAAVLAVLGLAFRSLVWASWEPYPGDPYGPSDLIDLLLVVLVFLLAALSVLAGLGLLVGRPRRPGVLIAGLVIPLVYCLLRDVLPTHRLW
ncbi:hypothetical protein [Aquipseudomonas ullengensis]|uniref:Uncharacterized protein n=1 Tax=Aquipseudomonas ullengensis TaxID=2759166 RepID=A0A7W4QCN9_9GAMM|nr:hypothetical protein [Pseudomonas ullengensis]MBB2495181.1 hypothetical protein [Pseudomonas ullengensis]